MTRTAGVPAKSGAGAAPTETVAEAAAAAATTMPLSETRVRFLSFQLSSESGRTVTVPPVPPALAPVGTPNPRQTTSLTSQTYQPSCNRTPTSGLSAIRALGCGLGPRRYPQSDERIPGEAARPGQPFPAGFPRRPSGSPPGPQRPGAGGGDDRSADHRRRHHHRGPRAAADRERPQGGPGLGDLGRDRLSAGD